jgi:hypothetical protein
MSIVGLVAALYYQTNDDGDNNTVLAMLGLKKSYSYSASTAVLYILIFIFLDSKVKDKIFCTKCLLLISS